LIQTTTTVALPEHMYFIGLDVHKKTMNYCVKDASVKFTAPVTTATLFSKDIFMNGFLFLGDVPA
jgi:hypothetical protein